MHARRHTSKINYIKFTHDLHGNIHKQRPTIAKTTGHSEWVNCQLDIGYIGLLNLQEQSNRIAAASIWLEIWRLGVKKKPYFKGKFQKHFDFSW